MERAMRPAIGMAISYMFIFLSPNASVTGAAKPRTVDAVLETD